MVRLIGSILVLVCLTITSFAAQIHSSIYDLDPVKITYPGSFRYDLGAVVAGGGDFDGDGYQDLAIGAPSFDATRLGRLFERGAVFIVFGKAFENPRADIDLSQPQAPIILVTSSSESQVGSGMAFLGDCNADGFDDLGLTTVQHHSAYVIYGRSDHDRILPLADHPDRVMEITNTGHSVSTVGDFNGDGFSDVIFGNPYAEEIDSGNHHYAVGNYTLLFGRDGFASRLDALVPGPTHYTDRGSADSLFGNQLSGGVDLNADGFSDIIVTAPQDGKNQAGRAYIIYGNESNFRDNRVEYSFILEHVKHGVRACKDINGDGFPDLLVGMDDNTLFVLKGGKHMRGTLDLSKKIDAGWGTILHGAQTAYPAGDLNGDGFQDIAVAMPNAQVGDKILAGRVLFLFGSVQWPAEIDVNQLIQGQYLPIDYILVDGNLSFETFGASVAALGDISNDGFDDVLIGAPTVHLSGDTLSDQPGAAYVIQGVNMYYALQTHRSVFTQEGARH